MLKFVWTGSTLIFVGNTRGTNSFFSFFVTMEDVIVLYPSPGRGHLISMVEIGKLILKHHPSFVITILILSGPNTNTNSTAPNYVASSTTKYITTVNSTTPSISFHHLPPISEVSTQYYFLWRTEILNPTPQQPKSPPNPQNYFPNLQTQSLYHWFLLWCCFRSGLKP